MRYLVAEIEGLEAEVMRLEAEIMRLRTALETVAIVCAPTELSSITAYDIARAALEKPETTVEHIARDIREGRFPKRSDD